MKHHEIYEAAVRLVCEDPESVNTDDYYDRAPYILATFLSDCAAQDQRYRKAHGMEAAAVPTVAYADLTEDFAFCDALVLPATYYLAAMLVADENEALCERFFALYTDSIARLQAELPLTSEQIADRYNLM